MNHASRLFAVGGHDKHVDEHDMELVSQVAVQIVTFRKSFPATPVFDLLVQEKDADLASLLDPPKARASIVTQHIMWPFYDGWMCCVVSLLSRVFACLCVGGVVGCCFPRQAKKNCTMDGRWVEELRQMSQDFMDKGCTRPMRLVYNSIKHARLLKKTVGRDFVNKGDL